GTSSSRVSGSSTLSGREHRCWRRSSRMSAMSARRLARWLGAAMILVLLLLVPAWRAGAGPVHLAVHAAGDPKASFDEQFIDMMVPHHAGAVAMGQVALRRAQHPQIKKLAQAIVRSQAKEI